jgi:hypothetical protein
MLVNGNREVNELQMLLRQKNICHFFLMKFAKMDETIAVPPPDQVTRASAPNAFRILSLAFLTRL